MAGAFLPFGGISFIQADSYRRKVWVVSTTTEGWIGASGNRSEREVEFIHFIIHDKVVR
jgi:hypothetical protein